MNSSKILLFLTLSAVALTAAPPHGRRFAWLANDPNNSYDNATLAGIREVVGFTGATVDPFFAGFDPATQLAQCRQALASGLYSGLFIEAADAVAIEPCVALAHSKKIPVVATDLPIGPDLSTVQPQVPGEVGASFIPAPRWGHAITGILPQVCQGLASCNVFYLAGISTFAIDVIGVQAVQAAAPAVHLSAVDQGFYDTAISKQAATTQLIAHPEINVVIASGDQMALGVEQAAQALGRTVRIVGAGAGATAIDAVKAGRWFGTFNALPRTEGELGAGLMEINLINNRFKPIGLDPIAVTGLPEMWTKTTLAQHPTFVPQWPGPM